MEIEQIQRISAMLGGTIAAGTMVTVTTADGRKRAGKLVSHQAGSRLTKRGTVTAHYGSIELATATRTDEINFSTSFGSLKRDGLAYSGRRSNS